jgi:hypothetical protein
VVERILEAKKEAKGNAVDLMVYRFDQLFQYNTPIYRETLFMEAKFPVEESEAGSGASIGIDLAQDDTRRVHAVADKGQAKTKGVAKGHVLVKVGGADVSKDAKHGDIIALIDKAKGAGELTMEFYTGAPKPKLLVENSLVKCSKDEQQHFTTALFGASNPLEIGFHAENLKSNNFGWRMSGNGAVMSVPCEGFLSLYSVAKGVKEPFVKLPFGEVSELNGDDKCKVGCLSGDSTVAVLGGARTIIAYVGKYEQAAGNEASLVAVSTSVDGEGREIEAGKGDRKPVAAKIVQPEGWTLKRMVMAPTGRLVAIWHVAEGSQEKNVGSTSGERWIVERYDVVGIAKEANRYARCGIQQAGQFELPEGEVVSENINIGSGCLYLDLLVSARVVSRDATGLPAETDGEVVAVAVRLKDTVVLKDGSAGHRCRVVIREWATKRSNKDNRPRPIGKWQTDLADKGYMLNWAMSSTTESGNVIIALAVQATNTVYIYDCKAGAKAGVLVLGSSALAVCISNDGAYIFTHDGTHALTVFGVRNQRVLRTINLGVWVKRSLWVSDDCSVVVSSNKAIRLQGGAMAPVGFSADEGGGGTIRSVRASGKRAIVAAALRTSGGSVVNAVTAVGITEGANGVVLIGIDKKDGAVYICQGGGSAWAKLGMEAEHADDEIWIEGCDHPVSPYDVDTDAARNSDWACDLRRREWPGCDRQSFGGDVYLRQRYSSNSDCDVCAECAQYFRKPPPELPRKLFVDEVAVGAGCIFGRSGHHVYQKQLGEDGGDVGGMWVKLGGSGKAVIKSIAAAANSAHVYGVCMDDKYNEGNAGVYRHAGGVENRWVKRACKRRPRVSRASSLSMKWRWAQAASSAAVATKCTGRRLGRMGLVSAGTGLSWAGK